MKRLARRNREPDAGPQEDLGLRFARLLDRRNGENLEPGGEVQFLEQRRQVRIPVGNDREKQTPTLQSIERRSHVLIDRPGRRIVEVRCQPAKGPLRDRVAVQEPPHAVQETPPEGGLPLDTGVPVACAL